MRNSHAHQFQSVWSITFSHSDTHRERERTFLLDWLNCAESQNLLSAYKYSSKCGQLGVAAATFLLVFNADGMMNYETMCSV